MDPTSKPAPAWNNELHDVLRMVRRTGRKWRAGVVAFVAVLAVAAAVLLFWPKEWRSESVVYYREGMQWTMGDAPNPRRMGERFRDSLLARALLTRVIEEMGLYPALVKSGRMVEAVEEMRLAVDFRIDQSDVYVISYTGDTPELAQRVTAKLTEMLIAENSRIQTEQARVAGEFLQTEKRRTEADLAAKEGALLSFLAKHPEFASEQSALGGSLRARARQAATPLSDHESEALAALRREEDRLRRQLTSPEQNRPPQDPSLVAAKEDAEAKLRAAQRDLSEKRANFTEQHPDVRAAEIAAKEAAETYKRALAALTAAEPRVLEGRLNQIQQEIATLRRFSAEGRPAQPDPSRNSEAARRIVSDEAEWARLSREAAEARERFQQLESRQFVASITANMAASGQSSQIVVIDPAYVPVRPTGTSRTAKVLIGFLLAMMTGVGVAFLVAFYDDRVLQAADLERLQLAPVLLEIEKGSMPGEVRAHPPAGASRAVRAAAEGGAPARRMALATVGSVAPGGQAARLARQAQAIAAAPMPDARLAVPDAAPPKLVRVHHLQAPPITDPRLVMLNAPESAAAAAYRVLCHRLREHGNPRAILVTSPNRAEGKSLCALNLALALVESERARAVLLETHHQAPSLAHILGFEPPVGASEQIEAHRERPSQPWEAVETSLPRLHTVAIAPGSTTRPILDGTLNLFVAAFRLAGYDYVVIDGPDALGSADVTLMEESIDGLLMTVRGESTRVRAIRSAVEQVGTKKLLGFALFGSNPA